MIFKDYYKILELDTSKVTLSQVKASYREQAKKYHPDVNVSNRNAEERFKDINEAYVILSDEKKKRRYDRTWNAYKRRKAKRMHQASFKQKNEVKKEFINLFFGEETNALDDNKKKEKLPKGTDINTSIEITAYEAFNGNQKRIKMKDSSLGNDKYITVNIPAGINNNEKIRIKGQGNSSLHGGLPGDLYIAVKIKENDKFKIEGMNISTILCLAPWEAALSKKVSLNGIDGEITLYIPEGTQSGEKIIIPEKGFKDRKGNRGDLIVETKIMIPSKLTESEKELFRKMKMISKFNPREEAIIS